MPLSLSVFLCVSEVPGVVSRSCMTRIIICTKQENLCEASLAISSFPLKTVEEYHSPAMCFRTGLIPFFFPGNSSGEGVRMGAESQRVCWHDWGALHLMSVLLEL